MEQLRIQREDAAREVRTWEDGIRERELKEKRRRAPGWLDSEARILEPERGSKEEDSQGGGHLMDAPSEETEQERKKVEDLGSAMDRAFGGGLGD